ncbi:hypothetical protein SAMN04488109_1636 [Chryseolinea serpens]|uniref:Uncharacterized protein n=1 Tax=Chryseolinea serpens TaxID=947013 RepID=A0A1M5MBH1_9BACT|nr:hypothetical protein [Chryseolinea serpens]SHG74073.1 hypothetical protein SAMN04488109_1636 [Chryseolinea serpens]
MAKHMRIFWGPHVGRLVCTVNWSSIRGDRLTGDSVVLVSACEGIRETNSTAPNDRMVGDANFTVSSIAPRFNAVSFVVDINWFEPLNLWTDVTVFEENERVVQGFVTR